MTKWNILLTAIIAVAVSISIAVAFGQSTTLWETYSDSAKNAYERGNYARAEGLFRLALDEAEKFGPRDRRVATSMSNLAGVYVAQGRY